MLISQNVPNLIGGVSQQSESTRFPSQCVEQINYYATILRGLSKRPPTNHVKEVAAADLFGGVYGVHKIDRSSGERFNLVLGNGQLKVFDLAGNERTVATPDGLGYLACSDPLTQLRTLTVADYTFVLNTTKVVQTTAQSPSNVRAPEALVFIKQVRDGSSYTIKLYDNPSNASPDHTIVVNDVKLGSTSTYTGPLVADQGDVCNALGVAFAASSADAVYDHYNEGELMWIIKRDSSNFRIEIECSTSEGMFVFKDSVQSFSLLPKRGWTDFRIRVKGDPEDAGDDYYLKFVPQDPNTQMFGDGVWEEAQAEGLSDDVLVASSLPHALVFDGTNFSFQKLSWTERKVGDQTTNPAPSFVGSTIADVFFRKNRLGFLSGGNEILSCAGDFFNFWRTTVIQLLDGDVIDVAGENDVGVLRNAVAASERLVLFSEQAQSIAQEGELLTPKTAGLKLGTKLQSTVTVKPETVGNSIVFPFKREGFSGLIDYAVAPDTGLFEGSEITEHAPNYIKGEIKAMAVSDTTNTVVVQASDASLLYVYKFFKQGQRRVQSSWGKFQFDGSVRGFHFFDSRLYLLILRNGRLCLEWLDLAPGAKDYKNDGSAVFVTHLDRRATEIVLSPSYNGTLDETSFTLPYLPATSANVRVVSRGAAYGSPLQVKSISGSTVKVFGNKAAEPVWVGEVVRSEQELTKPALRERREDGEYVVSDGRFQVRNGLVTVDETLDLKVEVTPQGRPTFTYSVASRVLGTDLAISGSALTPRSVPFRFPVYSKNDQVTIKFINDSYLPCHLLSLDWEALYAVRARRI